MGNKHYTDEELIERLYGLDRNCGHLDICQDCRSRLATMEQRRSLVASHEPNVTPAFLAEQRHAVWARIEKPASSQVFVRAASAFAAMAVLVVGFLVYHPASPPPAQTSAMPAVTDEQLYAEISTIVDTPEPLAATPIRGLFEEHGEVTQ